MEPSTHPVKVPFTPNIVTPFLILAALRFEDPTITMLPVVHRLAAHAVLFAVPGVTFTAA